MTLRYTSPQLHYWDVQTQTVSHVQSAGPTPSHCGLVTRDRQLYSKCLDSYRNGAAVVKAMKWALLKNNTGPWMNYQASIYVRMFQLAFLY